MDKVEVTIKYNITLWTALKMRLAGLGGLVQAEKETELTSVAHDKGTDSEHTISHSYH